MAVLRHLSFDYHATADLTSLGGVSATPVVTDATNPLLGSYLYMDSTSDMFRFSWSSSPASIWFHMRVRFDTAASFNSFKIVVGESLYTHLILSLSASGLMRWARSDRQWDSSPGYFSESQVVATGTQEFRVGQWYSLEGEITINATTGVVKTWVNGKADLNSTSADTYYNGTVGASSMALFGLGTVDDVVVGDTTGSNTGHPGDIRVDCMKPNANGTDSDFTLSTGSDDYAVVDDPTTNTTDYMYSTTVGNKNSVNLAALTNAGGTILAVQVTVYATKNEAGPCGFKIYLLIGGTRYYSSEFFPSWGSWAYFHYVWDLDPSTSAAWTESNFNSAEAGVERTT